ncbi:MAG: hypothetical protein OSA42_01655 [Porticoccaceae bacterium]|nr:hypothetical protein [Porticoccaceae bacterium]
MTSESILIGSLLISDFSIPFCPAPLALAHSAKIPRLSTRRKVGRLELLGSRL